jgi:hypothetical protein
METRRGKKMKTVLETKTPGLTKRCTLCEYVFGFESADAEALPKDYLRISFQAPVGKGYCLGNRSREERTVRKRVRGKGEDGEESIRMKGFERSCKSVFDVPSAHVYLLGASPPALLFIMYSTSTVRIPTPSRRRICPSPELN